MDVTGINNSGIRVQQYDPIVKENIDEPVSDESRENTKPAAMQAHKEDEQPLSDKEQQRRMERLQDTLKNHNIEISYNEEVNRYAIKVLDADSKEVVREIPSEKTLDMFAKMLEIEGLLVDEKR